MKKQNTKKKHFYTGILIAFLILCALLGIWGIPHVLRQIKGPTELDSLASFAENENAYVTASIDFIYDYYGEEYKGKHLVARNYLIDRGDGYMGLRISGATMEQADALLNACLDYMKGDAEFTAIEAAGYTVSGILKPMSEEHAQMYRTYLNYESMTFSEQDSYHFYYIDVR